jgi:hypothetical protein
MKTFVLIIFSTLFQFAPSFGKEKLANEPIWRVGLNYHIQFHQIDFNPYFSLGFKNSEIGAGLNYLQYYRKGLVVNHEAYGFNFFFRQYVLDYYFFHAEFLQAVVPYRYPLDFQIRHVNSYSVLAGMGLKYPVSERTNILGFLLFDFNHSEIAAYRNRFLLKVGVDFSFRK